MSDTRNLVQNWWDALPPEQRARFEGAFGPELDEQVAKARETIAKIEAKYAPVPSEQAAPNLLELRQGQLVPVSAEDAANLPVHQGPLVTIFLDGVIKRPAPDAAEDFLQCAWCHAGVFAPDGFALPDGWGEIEVAKDVKTETGADFLYICPTCVKQELPE